MTVELCDNRDEAATVVELMILKSDVITVCHVIMQIDVIFHNSFLFLIVNNT